MLTKESVKLLPHFPQTKHARADGLLAMGGEITPEWILTAYRYGIFPWFNEGSPPLWWAPDPRMVFRPNAFYRARSLQKLIRQKIQTDRPLWRVAFNRQFTQIMRQCANRAEGSWIHQPMIDSYTELFQRGYAFSCELYDETQHLIGGLYGIRIGRMLYGESMFSKTASASKVVLSQLMAWMARHNLPLLDAQVVSPHLCSMGAIAMPRQDFEKEIAQLCACSPIAFPVDD